MGLPTSCVPFTPAQLYAPSEGPSAASRAADTPVGCSDHHTCVIPLSLSKGLLMGSPHFPQPLTCSLSHAAYHTPPLFALTPRDVFDGDPCPTRMEGNWGIDRGPSARPKPGYTRSERPARSIDVMARRDKGSASLGQAGSILDQTLSRSRRPGRLGYRWEHRTPQSFWPGESWCSHCGSRTHLLPGTSRHKAPSHSPPACPVPDLSQHGGPRGHSGSQGALGHTRCLRQWQHPRPPRGQC